MMNSSIDMFVIFTKKQFGHGKRQKYCLFINLGSRTSTMAANSKCLKTVRCLLFHWKPWDVCCLSQIRIAALLEQWAPKASWLPENSSYINRVGLYNCTNRMEDQTELLFNFTSRSQFSFKCSSTAKSGWDFCSNQFWVGF